MVQIEKKLSVLHLPLPVRFVDSLCTCKVCQIRIYLIFRGVHFQTSENLHFFIVPCIARNYFLKIIEWHFVSFVNHTSKRKIRHVNKKYMTCRTLLFFALLTIRRNRQIIQFQSETTFNENYKSCLRVTPNTSSRTVYFRTKHRGITRYGFSYSRAKIRIRNRTNRESVGASSTTPDAVRTSPPHVRPFPPHTIRWRICTASFLVDEEGNRTAFPPLKAILPVAGDAVPVVHGIGHGRSFSWGVRN